MPNKGMYIKIPPVAAASLRELWAEMRRLNIAPADTIGAAIQNELINLRLRWSDAIAEYREEE